METPAKPEAGGKPARMVTATVARGRTVHDLDGNRVLPGAEVALPAQDVARLRARGFLVDPKATEVKLGIGPNFGGPGHAQIRRG
ncbi:hypothetical protein ACQUFY_10785 [Robbsia andropogonis]|uniref:hypothetical protein n=1 Tax=Robbsia andropogonis TaxID=28092 RepID=UPI003D235BF6